MEGLIHQGHAGAILLGSSLSSELSSRAQVYDEFVREGGFVLVAYVENLTCLIFPKGLAVRLMLIGVRIWPPHVQSR